MKKPLQGRGVHVTHSKDMETGNSMPANPSKMAGASLKPGKESSKGGYKKAAKGK